MATRQSTKSEFVKVKDGWSPQTRLKKNCLRKKQRKKESPPVKKEGMMDLMRVRISTSQVTLDALSVVCREQKLIPHTCDVIYARDREGCVHKS